MINYQYKHLWCQNILQKTFGKKTFGKPTSMRSPRAKSDSDREKAQIEQQKSYLFSDSKPKIECIIGGLLYVPSYADLDPPNAY